MTTDEQLTTTSDVAIVGMAGRFPGARTIDQFWQNLRDGVESIKSLSEEELASAGISPDVFNQPNYVKAAPTLDNNIAEFDATFFGFSPREAEMLDPQQRFFLEGAWEALENAGYSPRTYGGRAGVYGGVGRNTYLLFNLYPNLAPLDSTEAFQTLIGNDKDFLTTRVSYLLNLKGASVTVQTACSTSLVAVHLACQSLLNGENDLALAGGVSLKVPHRCGYFYQEGGIYSPDGHCRSFDANAQGTVGGSGMAIVVLKRLEDAIADGDSVHAVIKGSAVANDGAGKVGYTAPSVQGQAEVIEEALAVADVNPETIQYVETHGTATPLGDPIEIQALTQAFRTRRGEPPGRPYCAIGSVKSNVGHLDAAAGVAGLLEAVLALKQQLIPPSLHFQEPNPEIDFTESPFFVNTQLSPWQRDTTPRRAGVSSFGIGGTNAHIILEEAPPIGDEGTVSGAQPLSASSPSRPWQLLLLSAKTATALDAATNNLKVHLEGNPDLNLADVAYTLQVGREAFPYRKTVVCRNKEEAITTLSGNGMQRQERCETSDRACVFLFPGQGAQYINMGRELYEGEPVYRASVDWCAEWLVSRLNLDLGELLYPNAFVQPEQLQQTAIAQPALFVVEYALAQLWRSWGVQPQAGIGHSIGEYVAACLAGVFSLEDALMLVAERGRLMQQMPGGAMLSVVLSAEAVEPLLGDRLSLAAINAPSLCVVSGDEDAIANLQSQLHERGVACRPLQVSHAFHSSRMAPAAEQFAQVVKRVSLYPPQIPFISNLTGTWITEEEALDPHYWAQQLCQPVLFSSGVAELLKLDNSALLEVGPGRTLTTLAQQQRDSTQVVLTSTRHPKEQTSDTAHILDTLGGLWLAGVAIDWQGFYASRHRRRIPLPTYPFERQRYWVEARPEHPPLQKKNSHLAEWFYTPTWKQAPLLGNPLPDSESRWLVFLDSEGMGDALASRLQQWGQSVITVAVGEQFTQLGENAYAITPTAAADYQTLWRELEASDRLPDQIVHLWGITPERSLDNLDTGFYSLLSLAQAMGRYASRETISLTLVTSPTHDITGSEVLFPTQATLQGACLVIPQEYPGVSAGTIDMEVPPESAQKARLAESLLHEIATSPPEPIVAYRGRHRWVQSFDSMPLERTGETPSPLRTGGIYLIAGGLGGMGLVLAEYLARATNAKLVLVTRSGLPEREEEDAGSRGAGAVQHLEELGSQVLVISADISDRAAMQAAIFQAEAHFGSINGVIHAAGVAGGHTMQLQTQNQAEEVLAAKVRGTLILDELLRDHALDFMILCSSLSAITGGFGQSDYCAANAFLDAFAHYRRATTGQLTISINWDTWQEVGMAVNTAVPELLAQRRQKNIDLGIAPNEGTEAFRRVLDSNFSQVVVSTKALDAVIAQSRASDSLKEKLALLEAESGQESISQTAHPRPNLGTSYVPPRNESERAVAEIWQELLGIKEIGVHDDFFELGGHSLLAIRIATRLGEIFQQDLPLNSIFETPTIAGLAATIDQTQVSETPTYHQTIPSVARDDTARLPSEVDELSESEVESLLGELLLQEDGTIKN
ncbi:MAG: hypothetical protein BRC46_09230 [Cyanobacteria bacterium QS_6_48_18]|nr:MAG: hypothetical protein BRC46_09230 [Cyanobacteria bacterium QS_6_48_18]